MERHGHRAAKAAGGQRDKIARRGYRIGHTGPASGRRVTPLLLRLRYEGEVLHRLGVTV